ncbi:hypothetical protein GCM10022224_016820 [Nonomuraea antimicrobica]|uniref:Uncharacterized protein n=1 Tax=Nonomuraea antimicrobica TaxID=561173 RepID=A0ABP7BC66_9ACTN
MKRSSHLLDMAPRLLRAAIRLAIHGLPFRRRQALRTPLACLSTPGHGRAVQSDMVTVQTGYLRFDDTVAAAAPSRPP